MVVGYAASQMDATPDATGEGQSHDAPFGHAGERLHEWMFATGWWHGRLGQPGGSGGVDDVFLRLFAAGIGAEIMGAGEFGPPGWHEDPEWKGWWGLPGSSTRCT